MFCLTIAMIFIFPNVRKSAILEDKRYRVGRLSCKRICGTFKSNLQKEKTNELL